jgi:hypothetical protein
MTVPVTWRGGSECAKPAVREATRATTRGTRSASDRIVSTGAALSGEIPRTGPSFAEPALVQCPESWNGPGTSAHFSSGRLGSSKEDPSLPPSPGSAIRTRAKEIPVRYSNQQHSHDTRSGKAAQQIWVEAASRDVGVRMDVSDEAICSSPARAARSLHETAAP